MYYGKISFILKHNKTPYYVEVSPFCVNFVVAHLQYEKYSKWLSAINEKRILEI